MKNTSAGDSNMETIIVLCYHACNETKHFINPTEYFIPDNRIILKATLQCRTHIG